MEDNTPLHNEENILDEQVIQDTIRPEKKPYPSILQAFGLLGILLVINIVVSMIFSGLMMSADGVVKSIYFCITYIATFGVCLLAAIKLRQHNRFEWNTYPKVAIPILAVLILALIPARIPLLEIIPMPDYLIEMFKDLLHPDIVSLFTVAIAAPLLEEFIFRGVVLDGFLKRYSPTKAIIWSSILFGIAHLNPWQFISAFAIGCVMGWVYYRTKNLWLCIFMHFVNNFVGFAPALFVEDFMDTSVKPSDSFENITHYWLAVGASVLIAIVAIILLKRVFDNYYTNTEPDVTSMPHS